jgi:pimeloyl-ACP methyl ester carboxylesterase
MCIGVEDWLAGGERIVSRHGQMFVQSGGGGAPVLLLHGFPTWSWDWAGVAAGLPGRWIAPDLLGYGFSAKGARDLSVNMQADAIEDLAAALSLDALHLVAHDYGTIVAQELLDRGGRGRLRFAIQRVALLNAGIVYIAYRPTRLQRLLALPMIGKAIARRITADKLRAGLDAVLSPGRALSDNEFAGLWRGISHDDGHHQAHRLIRYNAERTRHAGRWESALAAFHGPLTFIWGLEDPVAGRHVLAAARAAYPRATVTELAGIGHYPQLEAPTAVAAALSEHLA